VDSSNKFDARLQVVDKLARVALSDTVDGVMHLFEHKYDELFFWYGVAEAAIPEKAFWQHAPDLAWVERVNVVLEDGRAGQCQILSLTAQRGATGDYMRIQLSGASALKPLDSGSPHFCPFFP
jgi:hypothetical protein